MAKQSKSNIEKRINAAVEAFELKLEVFVKLASRVRDDLADHVEMKSLIHSVKSRHKDPDHLRDKLRRHAAECGSKGRKFDIDEKNLFSKINDLAGVRLIHLHTSQIKKIYPLMMEIFEYYKYKIVVDPWAYTWDIETQALFNDIGIKVVPQESLYTSIHCIVSPHYSDDTCEVQIRTIAEELWGEVSHTVSYPHPTSSVACKEQLLALARFTSGCSRLVDSIFASAVEYDHMTEKQTQK